MKTIEEIREQARLDYFNHKVQYIPFDSWLIAYELGFRQGIIEGIREARKIIRES